jgi:hypothetical protein
VVPAYVSGHPEVMLTHFGRLNAEK